MNQLVTRLTQNQWTTLVSLPANDVELAKAALGAGVHGLKVHINVEHFASGTRFGSFREERERLEQIATLAREHGANVGVVPGAGGEFASAEEFRALAEIGIDYFDAYPADAPAWSLQQQHLDVMMAAYHGGDLVELSAMEGLGMKLCEASIMPHEEYGKPLSALDLARYGSLRKALSVPIIVPSQKKLTPEDIPALISTGVNGVLIGAIVTGRDAAGIARAAGQFVAAHAAGVAGN